MVLTPYATWSTTRGSALVHQASLASLRWSAIEYPLPARITMTVHLASSAIVESAPLAVLEIMLVPRMKSASVAPASVSSVL